MACRMPRVPLPRCLIAQLTCRRIAQLYTQHMVRSRAKHRPCWAMFGTLFFVVCKGVFVVAFRIACVLESMEFRAIQSGRSAKSGNNWMSLVFENPDAEQLNVSVPSEMQADVYSLGLRKGDVCMISVRAVAMADGNSFVQLTALPELMDESADGSN